MIEKKSDFKRNMFRSFGDIEKDDIKLERKERKEKKEEEKNRRGWRKEEKKVEERRGEGTRRR